MTLAFPKPERKPRQPRKGLRRHGKTKHARRERDFEYMAWVSTRPCLARLLAVQGNDCSGRIHVHHMFGRRGQESDTKTVPLCDSHHSAWHEHRGIFSGWDRERRQHWATWAVEFTQLERTGGVL